MTRPQQHNGDMFQQEAILRLVAEQIKQPLLQIAREAELQTMQTDDLVVSQNASFFQRVSQRAEHAMKLIDSYVLGMSVSQQSLDLELEPISLSALLYDTAQDLQPLARQHDVKLELAFAGRYGQVMAHSSGLRAALFDIGAALIEATHSARESRDASQPRVQLAAHKIPQGLVAGLYTSAVTLSAKPQNISAVRQPFAATSAQPMAGVLVAETLLQAMQSTLRIGRFRGSNGWATTLQPSHQIRLV